MIAGHLLVFATAFLSATVLPLSSEAVLAALVVADGAAALALMITATAGNTLGAVVNWGLGRYLWRWRDRRWFPLDPARLDRASRWFSRYGVWSLLLSWVPIVGDPLTLVAGLLRVRLRIFLPLVAAGKAARYAVVAAAAYGLPS